MRSWIYFCLVNFWSTKKTWCESQQLRWNYPGLFFLLVIFLVSLTVFNISLWVPLFFTPDCVNLPEIVLLANMRSCALWNLQWTFWLCESQTVTLWQLQRMKFVSSLVVFLYFGGVKVPFWTENIHRTGSDCWRIGMTWYHYMWCSVHHNCTQPIGITSSKYCTRTLYLVQRIFNTIARIYTPMWNRGSSLSCKRNENMHVLVPYHSCFATKHAAT